MKESIKKIELERDQLVAKVDAHVGKESELQMELSEAKASLEKNKDEVARLTLDLSNVQYMSIQSDAEEMENLREKIKTYEEEQKNFSAEMAEVNKKHKAREETWSEEMANLKITMSSKTDVYTEAMYKDSAEYEKLKEELSGFKEENQELKVDMEHELLV